MRLGPGLLYEGRTLQGARPKLADFCSAVDTFEVTLHKPEPTGQRDVWFKWQCCATDVYDRATMQAGAEFSGPAIVEQVDSTVVIPPQATAKVDQYMNILIRVKD